MPLLVDTIAALRARLNDLRRTGTVGLVPTMGALHAGHVRLMTQARRECDHVVVSIFVNPLQFDRDDDLRRYPRSLQNDLDLCTENNVDLVFGPGVAEMYPQEPCVTVAVGRLADHLCGPHRPGHFQGVATVVLKLFEIVRPDRAYFGEKDAQQLAIIRRMVRDFDMPITVVGVPTVRESDGLALSSRNQQLTETERRSAAILYQALAEADRQIASGVADAALVTGAARALVPNDAELRLEYLEAVDPDNMQPVEQILGPVRVAGALWVGRTRLIDNVLCTPIRRSRET